MPSGIYPNENPKDAVSMSSIGSTERPLRVAVVGSGPSAFYAVEALYKNTEHVRVDMFERLPTPFGLVRGGVAPDHHKIKSVTRVYERIASDPRFAYFGNVTIGRDITVSELRGFYDAVLFACGAESDRRLGIPGEDLPGSHTATAFVGWYNGHPDYRDQHFDLSGETAVIVGQGNVAVDVCRILAKTPDELRETDIADYALDALAESRIRDIYMVGRRGPVQAKFTQPELREMGELAECDPVVYPAELEIDPRSQAELEAPSNKTSAKNLAVLEGFVERGSGSKRKRFHILFLRSPVELKGAERLQSVVLERNRLEGQPFALKATGTGLTEELHCDIFFRSVGYRGTPLPDVPFDEHWGVFPNEKGRILDNHTPVPGLYAAGWIKRGPSGIIGTNKPDSVETVKSLLEDMPDLPPCPRPDSEAVAQLLASRGVRVVTFDDWHRLDQLEIERGKPKGKPRDKFTTAEAMLAALDEGPVPVSPCEEPTHAVP